MATSLARQLQKINFNVESTSYNDSFKLRTSLLVTDREAAQVDLITVFNNAVKGLDQLSKANFGFSAFSKTLCSTKIFHCDINQLTKQEIIKIDESLEILLKLLGGHFLHPSCFQVLEYLIRKFRVNYVNPESFILCGLPYHETSNFTRLVQCAHLDNTRFSFLKPMQLSGASLPRKSLVLRCVIDKSLLELICEYSRSVGNNVYNNTLASSLYSVLVCEVIMTSKKVDEDFLRTLLPFILHGIGKNDSLDVVSKDFRAANYMIIVQLSHQTIFAYDLIEVLLKEIVDNAPVSMKKDIVLLLTHLTITQKLSKLPDALIQYFVKNKKYASVLRNTWVANSKVEPLCILIIKGLICNLDIEGGSEFLIKMAKSSEHASCQALCNLLSAVLENGTKPNYLKVARVICKLNRQMFEDVLMKKLDELKHDSHAVRSLNEFVSNSSPNSSFSLLKSSALTIVNAIDHHSKNVRLEAVGQLDSIYDNESEHVFIKNAIVRRLDDSDEDIILAILKLKSLSLVPIDILKEKFDRELTQMQEVMSNLMIEKRRRSTSRSVFKKILSLLDTYKFDKEFVMAKVLGLGLLFGIDKKTQRFIEKAWQHVPLLDGYSQNDNQCLEQKNKHLLMSVAQHFNSESKIGFHQIFKLTNNLGKLLILNAARLACAKGFGSATILFTDIILDNQDCFSEVLKVNEAIWDDKLSSFDVSFSHMFVEDNRRSQNLLVVLCQSLEEAVLNWDVNNLHRVEELVYFILKFVPSNLSQLLICKLLSKLQGLAISPFCSVLDRLINNCELHFQENLLKAFLMLGDNFPIHINIVPYLISSMSSDSLDVRVCALRALQRCVEYSKGSKGDLKLPNYIYLYLIEVCRLSSNIIADNNALATVSGLILNGTMAATSDGMLQVKALETSNINSVVNFFMGNLSDDGCERCGIEVKKSMLKCMAAVINVNTLLVNVAPTMMKFTLKEQLSQKEKAYMLLILDIVKKNSPSVVLQHESVSLLLKHFQAYLGNGDFVDVCLDILGIFDTPVFDALHSDDKLDVIKILIGSTTLVTVEEVRKCAVQLLAKLSVDASLFCDLLLFDVPISHENSIKSKKIKRTESTDKYNLVALKSCSLVSNTLACLQWKENVFNKEKLVSVLCNLISQVSAFAGSNDLSSSEDFNGKEVNGFDWIVNCDFIIQLSLSVMLTIIGSNADARILEFVDLPCIVKCTTASRNRTTNNLALQILESLSNSKANEKMKVTLDVITSVANSPYDDDEPSQSIGVAAVGSLVPVWIATGYSFEEIVNHTCQVCETCSTHKAVLLLSSLLSHMPKEQNLPQLLFFLLKNSVVSENGENFEVYNFWQTTNILNVANLICLKVEFETRARSFVNLLKCCEVESKGICSHPLLIAGMSLISHNISSSSKVSQSRRLKDCIGSFQDLLDMSFNYLKVFKCAVQKINHSDSKTTLESQSGINNLITAVEYALPTAIYLDYVLNLLKEDGVAVHLKVLKDLILIVAKSDFDAKLFSSKIALQIASIIELSSDNMILKLSLHLYHKLVTLHSALLLPCLGESLTPIVSKLNTQSLQIRSSVVKVIKLCTKTYQTNLLPLIPNLVSAVIKEAYNILKHSGSGKEKRIEVELFLTAIVSFAKYLGRFLGPFLAEIVELLINIEMESTESLIESKRLLICNVPHRILLPACIKASSCFKKECGASVNLLGMINGLVKNLDHHNAMLHANELWTLLLNALTARESQSDALSVHKIEHAAISVVLTLTLKLSEDSFKPLFKELSNWASVDVGGFHRQIVLFKLIYEFVCQLRDVFVPYIDDMLGAFLEHLGSNTESLDSPEKKGLLKDDLGELTALILASVFKYLCFKKNGFGDEIFGELSNALISYLHNEIVVDVSLLDENLRIEFFNGDTTNFSDAVRKIAHNCIAQLAVACQSDHQCKRINHEILMLTRDNNEVTRMIAVETLLQIISKLGEEYIVLIPEAMPFLAELLEDPILNIQNETKKVLSILEEIAGETLSDYLRSS